MNHIHYKNKNKLNDIGLTEVLYDYLSYCSFFLKITIIFKNIDRFNPQSVTKKNLQCHPLQNLLKIPSHADP